MQTTGGATASDPLSANPPCETGQSARLSISSQDASTATETPRPSTGAGTSHQDASTATETPCPSVIISNPRKSKDPTVDVYKHMNPYCIATQKVWESRLNPKKTHTEQMCEKLQSGMRTSLRKGQQRAYAKSCWEMETCFNSGLGPKRLHSEDLNVETPTRHTAKSPSGSNQRRIFLLLSSGWTFSHSLDHHSFLSASEKKTWGMNASWKMPQ